jgi:hypothetical protein
MAFTAPRQPTGLQKMPTGRQIAIVFDIQYPSTLCRPAPLPSSLTPLLLRGAGVAGRDPATQPFVNLGFDPRDFPIADRNWPGEFARVTLPAQMITAINDALFRCEPFEIDQTERHSYPRIMLPYGNS